MSGRKPREKSEARRLRAEGWSYRRIAAFLEVSVSSVSLWTRDVRIPEPPPPGKPTREGSAAGTKRCSRCERELPLACFNRFKAGRQWWCRECFRAYYLERREHHRRRSNELKARRVTEARAFVTAHLQAHPCADCGEADTIVLECDHVGPKRTHVSTLVRRGVRLDVLAGEIARCEVVCANCHRRRTAKRAGWRRLAPERPGRAFRSARHERNVRFALEALRSGCVDCGEADLCVLDFDHIGEKRASVLRLAYDEASLERLALEIARCEVRCANCHRRRTLAAGGQRAVPPAGVEPALTA